MSSIKCRSSTLHSSNPKCCINFRLVVDGVDKHRSRTDQFRCANIAATRFLSKAAPKYLSLFRSYLQLNVPKE